MKAHKYTETLYNRFKNKSRFIFSDEQMQKALKSIDSFLKNNKQAEQLAFDVLEVDPLKYHEMITTIIKDFLKEKKNFIQTHSYE